MFTLLIPCPSTTLNGHRGSTIHRWLLSLGPEGLGSEGGRDNCARGPDITRVVVLREPCLHPNLVGVGWGSFWVSYDLGRYRLHSPNRVDSGPCSRPPSPKGRSLPFTLPASNGGGPTVNNRPTTLLYPPSPWQSCKGFLSPVRTTRNRDQNTGNGSRVLTT